MNKKRITTILLLACLFFTIPTAWAAGSIQSIEGVSRLKNLERLILPNHNIAIVPDELGNLPKLKELDLSGNKLTVVSKGITDAEELEILDLSNNLLTTIPDEIGQLDKLKKLSIASNTEVKHLPNSMEDMVNLESIDVTNTGIKCLPLAMEPIAITDKKPNGITYGLTVAFETGGGTAVDSIRLDQDQKIGSVPPDPIKDGFVFDGWFTDASFSDKWDFATDVVSDHMSLYAKWSGKPASIIFEENGGSTAIDLTGVTDQVITNRNMPSITRSGYTFGGWYTASDFSGAAVTQLPEKYPFSGITYHAKWIANSSTISFIENGGLDLSDLTGVTDEAILYNDMPTITRSGYTFGGWFAANDFSGAAVTNLPDKFPVDGMAYYAKWNADPSSIVFDENNGSITPDLSGYTDQTIINRNMPTITRSGYTFGGWYTASDFSGAAVTQLPEKYPVSGITYYAKWTAEASTITFEENSGSPATDLTGVTDQAIVDRNMPTITRSGYSFGGWYTASDFSGAAVTQLPEKYPVSGIKYYAKWTSEASTITFEENSGSPATDLTGVTDQAIADRNMPTITRSGYTFGGWYTASDFSGAAVIQLPATYPVSGITYYAKWTADASTITFIENGGSSAFDLGGVTDQTISNRNMPTITRSGYAFSGWFTASDFSGVAVTQLPEKYPVSGITYYAKWTANASTIAFEENSGSATSDLTGVTDQAITDRNMPSVTRVGYTLDGWYAASDFSGAVVTQLPATYPVTGITYYAKWTINTYTITFNSNGGSAVGLKVATHDSTITAPTEPTKANAFFDAWYKDIGLTQAWNFATDKVTSNMTLYAKWTDLPPAGNALETYTWEQIKLISESGKADDYFNVKDEKTAIINGQTYTFQIYGFAHDDKASGTGKAGITFGLKGLMVDTHVMNPNNQNYGGWDGSDMRAYLNGVTTTYQGTSYATTSIYSKLPADLKAVITPVKKYTSGGYGATALVTSTDNLFLFSEEEVGLGNYTYSTSGEGTQYPIFTDNASRIKTYPNTSTGWWWLRSAYNTNGNGFLGVHGDGNLNNNNAYTNYGVAFGFAI
ncbi:InlB B-repeat-containing protein [Acetobacterium wieringae]|uniref:InlB B-repeat-containing protein n=1 Tax=Acetobacterium wieringae TaxID=52694 RepID=UPI002B1FD0F4|nr:InlB B-repeat-containing protein [Acetobacterium wieringae]MEA4805016.1 InlB B-repeat-containing protein [Acetobacterium wieringae]